MSVISKINVNLNFKEADVFFKLSIVFCINLPYNNIIIQQQLDGNS